MLMRVKTYKKYLFGRTSAFTGGGDLNEVNVKEWFTIDHNKKGFQLMSTEEIVRIIQEIECKLEKEKRGLFKQESHETVLIYLYQRFD